MGYYTSWQTNLKLSRKITRDEYVVFTKLVEPFCMWWNIEENFWTDELHVYEDEWFKWYECETELPQILKLFTNMKIMVNGTMNWDWEEDSDVWTVYIEDNIFRMVQKSQPEDIVSFLRRNGFEDAANAADKFIKGQE